MQESGRKVRTVIFPMGRNMLERPHKVRDKSNDGIRMSKKHVFIFLCIFCDISIIFFVTKKELFLAGFFHN